MSAHIHILEYSTAKSEVNRKETHIIAVHRIKLDMNTIVGLTSVCSNQKKASKSTQTNLASSVLFKLNFQSP